MLGFRQILPPGVSLQEGWVNELSEMPRATQSQPITGVGRRRREFIAGRTCAALALRDLGVQDGGVPAGPTGAPVWPPGFVGSISHTRDYCAAAAASHSTVTGIGIDVEVARPFSIELLQAISTSCELAWWAGQRQIAHSLLLSAKESTFKAVYPLMKTVPAFQDIHLAIDLPLGSFTATSLCNSVLQRLLVSAEGRFRICGGYVFSVLWIRHTEKTMTVIVQ